ncbi:hypothetical protein [Arhodomonas sp. AD133]|uniref:hypothetical protein n=1 Tax=Arhodomonas sp. AD133 TaxID=3415009 RepID=UPI003EB76EB0
MKSLSLGVAAALAAVALGNQSGAHASDRAWCEPIPSENARVTDGLDWSSRDSASACLPLGAREVRELRRGDKTIVVEVDGDGLRVHRDGLTTRPSALALRTSRWLRDRPLLLIGAKPAAWRRAVRLCERFHSAGLTDLHLAPPPATAGAVAIDAETAVTWPVDDTLRVLLADDLDPRGLVSGAKRVPLARYGERLPSVIRQLSAGDADLRRIVLIGKDELQRNALPGRALGELRVPVYWVRGGYSGYLKARERLQALQAKRRRMAKPPKCG